MNFQNFMMNQALCAITSGSIWKDLHTCDRLSTYTMPDKDPNSFAFRIGLPVGAAARTYGIDKVSVSVPPDACGNRIVQDNVSVDNLPKTIEIAMIGADDNISYEHPLCSDVLRFDTVDALVDMLVKLVDGSSD